MQGRMRFVIFTLLAMMVLGVLTACGGGVSDTTIPAPPNSSPVTKGEDATTDLIIDAMDSALQQQAAAEEGVSVDQTSYYNSTDDLATVTSFYTSEMTNRGWEETLNQPGDGNAGLFYESGDQAAMIVIFDASLFGGSGSLVLTSNLSK